MQVINKTNLPKVIFLMGPTASGKTSLAIKLNKILPSEIISVDSALIYQGMNIGTGKPTAEELQQAPHHLLDIIDPSQSYSVSNFYYDALKKMSNITKAGNIPILVGGTMLYFKALLEGISPLPSADLTIRLKIKQQAEKYGWYTLHQKLAKIDPIVANRIHPNDQQRISRALEVFYISGNTLTNLIKFSRKSLPYQIYQFSTSLDNRELLNKRIEQRFYRMLNLGFETEVKSLFTRHDLCKDMPSIRCIGYRQMWSYLEGKISYNEMVYQSIYATKHLAKRQITWLNKWKGLHYLDSGKVQISLQKILKTINCTIT